MRNWFGQYSNGASQRSEPGPGAVVPLLVAEPAKDIGFNLGAPGGASKAEVIISDEEIDYPKAIAVDLLLALTQAAADKYGRDLKPSGILVVDSTKVAKVPNGAFAVYRLPSIDTARGAVGKAMVANIVSLGVIAGLSEAVSREALEQAVLARVPKGTEELNRRALEAGFALAGSPKAA